MHRPHGVCFCILAVSPLWAVCIAGRFRLVTVAGLPIGMHQEVEGRGAPPHIATGIASVDPVPTKDTICSKGRGLFQQLGNIGVGWAAPPPPFKIGVYFSSLCLVPLAQLMIFAIRVQMRTVRRSNLCLSGEGLGVLPLPYVAFYRSYAHVEFFTIPLYL